MRLAQLARKLGVKPADIQAFLAESEQSVELNPNARLSDEQVLVVVRHMNPSLEATIFQETATEPLPTITEVAEAVLERGMVVETSSESPTPEPTIGEPATEAEPEVIRAPKLELPGLKVVGKIELKESKKKEPEPPAEGEQKPERAERPAVPPARRQSQQRKWKNPLEVQRQREATEREEKRERELELKKQLRTQKYLKKVKSVPTKPVRRQEDEVIEENVDMRPAPKTWLGKFARWLTT